MLALGVTGTNYIDMKNQNETNKMELMRNKMRKQKWNKQNETNAKQNVKPKWH